MVFSRSSLESYVRSGSQIRSEEDGNDARCIGSCLSMTRASFSSWVASSSSINLEIVFSAKGSFLHANAGFHTHPYAPRAISAPPRCRFVFRFRRRRRYDGIFYYTVENTKLLHRHLGRIVIRRNSTLVLRILALPFYGLAQSNIKRLLDVPANVAQLVIVNPLALVVERAVCHKHARLLGFVKLLIILRHRGEYAM